MRILCSCLVLCVAFALPGISMGQGPIRLDGEFDDWAGLSDKLYEDPVGDATGGFDLSRVDAAVHGKTVFIRFDTQKRLNLQSGDPADGTLRLRFETSNNKGLVLDLRNRNATLIEGANQTAIAWPKLQFAALPTFATTDFELRVDLSELKVATGDTVRLQFEGSDRLAKPILLTITEAGAVRREKRDLTAPANSIRIASLNTLRQGSASRDRATEIKKLFELADADIYCFNEALEEPIFRSTFDNVLPPRFAGSKNVHWAATCGIVSRFPITPLTIQAQEAAALVHLPNNKKLVVVSAHFRCCGYSGSREDKTRVDEVELLLSDLQRMRDGVFGQDPASAGVMVLGDFNLVGSRTPLDLLNKAGLKDVFLSCPVDGSTMTWQGVSPQETFWPGRLDYVTVDTTRLSARGGFILNSHQLSVLRDEPTPNPPASDHSMLVVDIETR